jgi:hypothetical protein
VTSVLPLIDLTDDELRDIADQRLQEAGWLRLEEWSPVERWELDDHRDDRPPIAVWSVALCRSMKHDITMELRRSTVATERGWVMTVRVDGEYVWSDPFVPGFAGLDCWPDDGYVLAEKLQGAIPYLDGVVVFDEGGD